MEEGLPGEEPALAQEARAEKEAGAPVDRPEPPRPRNPRPGAEPRPQQVGRQKKKRLVQTGVQFPPQPTASVRASMLAPIACGLLDSATS